MSRRPLVPEAKEALDKINSEISNEIGLSYSDSDKADRPSKLNGEVGGNVGGLMTKRMVEAFEKKLVHK